jgi:hypothetical protein
MSSTLRDAARPSQRKSILSAKNLLATPEQRERRAELVKNNRLLPSVAGRLTKERRLWGLPGMLGLGSASHPRYFKLDPLAGTLSYYRDDKSEVMKYCFPLQSLEEVDTNHHHKRIWLKFGDSRWLKLTAENSEDFWLWMDAFARYIRPRKGSTTDVVTLAEQQARDVVKRDESVSIDQPQGSSPSVANCSPEVLPVSPSASRCNSHLQQPPWQISPQQPPLQRDTSSSQCSRSCSHVSRQSSCYSYSEILGHWSCTDPVDNERCHVSRRRVRFSNESDHNAM